MRFDGPTFAHAFLAVFTAASQDKKSPYHKSIALEIHLHGIQLVANDGRMMLTAYVPDLEHHYDGAPSRDTAPERTIVLNDDDGRGRGLLGYVCQLGTRHRYGFEDYTPGAVEIRVDHDQKLPPGAADQQTFEGMESVYTSLHVPDRERVFLELVPISVPDWRGILERQETKAGSRLGVALDPEILERLGKARKHAFGALQMSFGKAQRSLVRVEYVDSDPYVFGSILPLEDADADVYQDQPGDPDQVTITDAVLASVDKLGASLRSGESLTVIAGGKSATVHGDTGPATESDQDRLLASAIRLVVGDQLGSARMLQRKLAIPFARASEVMKDLEAHGIVGPTQGTTARAVLITPDQIDEAIAAIRNGGDR